MSEFNMNLQDIDQASLKAGTILQVTHAFSKTREDELDLTPGDMITVLECPDGGWCKGIKGIETKNPSTGWFPLIVSKVSIQTDNIYSDEVLASNDVAPPVGHKRSRSASIFGKVLSKSKTIKSFESDEKTSRTRSTSAPSHGTSIQSLSLSNDLESVADASVVSLNCINMPNDILTLRIPDSDRKDESARSSAQPRPLLSFKNSFVSSPTKEYMALKELADTEWHYLQDLYLIRHCRKVVSKLLALSDRAIKTLFGNLDQLIHVHELLNDDLEVLMVQGTQSASQLANIFAARMEDFLAYIEYGNNYQQSQDKLKRLSKKVNARDVFKRMSTQPRSRNLGLESFLIAPIQRICKYPLLLKQIMKDFDADGRDTSLLKEALVNMENNILLINDAMKQSPTSKKPLKSGKKSFEKPGCTSLKEEKVFLHLDKKNKKKAYLYLFNDSVVIAKASWGGKWTTILDVSLADPSFSINPSERAGECILNVKNSSLIVSFKSTSAQQSFKKTYANLLESCKGSKSPVVFDAVVALDEVADVSDDESEFSDNGGFSTSTISFDSSTPVKQRSMLEVYQSIPTPEISPKSQELEIELKNSTLKLETLQKENQDILAKNESLKETVSNLEELRDTLINQVNSLEEKNENLKFNVMDLEKQFETLKSETANILTETEQCNSDLQEEITFYKEIQERLNNVTLKAEDLTEKNESLSSEKILLELEIETLKSDLVNQQGALNDITCKNMKLESEIEEVKKSNSALSESVENLRTENAQLLSLQEKNIKNIADMMSIEGEQSIELIIGAISAHKDRRKTLELDLENSLKSIHQLEGENEKLKKDLKYDILRLTDVNKTLESERDKIMNENTGLKTEISNFKTRQILQNEKSNEYHQQIHSLISEKDSLNVAIYSLQDQLSVLGEKLENETKKYNSLQEKFDQQDNTLRSEHVSQISKIRTFEQQIGALVSERDSLNVTIDTLRNQISAFEEILQGDKKQHQELLDKLKQQEGLTSSISTANESLQAEYQSLLMDSKSHFDRISVLLSLEDATDRTQMSKSIENEVERLLQLQSDINEKENLKNQLLIENENLKTKLNISESSIQCGLGKINLLEDRVSQLLSEKSLNQVAIENMQNEISKLNSIIEKVKIHDTSHTKTAEDHKTLFMALTLEHQQLQSDYKALQTSQKSIIDRIISCLSLKTSDDLSESIKSIEEESKRLTKLEYDYKTLEALYHKSNQEKDQLSLQLNVYAKEQGDQKASIKQEYDSLQERFNILLNDLHNNQTRFYMLEQELGRKNSKVNDLEAKMQASAAEIHQMKDYISKRERMFNEEKASLTDHIKSFDARQSDNRQQKEAAQQAPPDFYYAMISKLEKEMMENKTQLMESKEALKAELKSTQVQHEKRGYCLRKLYGQLQEALSEKEKLNSRCNNSQHEIQNLQVDKSRLIVEREALKKQIEVLREHLSSANEKIVLDRGRKIERSDYITKERSSSSFNYDKEVKVWKTIFFEIEVILGLSERSQKNLPTLDQEVRVANTVSKIRSIVKEIKEARQESAESQDKITNMGASLRVYDVRMNELVSSITIMAQEIKSKTSDFESQIYEKNMMIDDLVKKTASDAALEALKTVKQERHNYELRLRDSNELIRQLSAEISVLKAELERGEKTIADQEVMISDFCIKTQRLQTQVIRLQERLEEAQALEADHIFELEKLEKRLKMEMAKKKVQFKSDHSISNNSAETLTSTMNLVKNEALSFNLKK